MQILIRSLVSYHELIRKVRGVTLIVCVLVVMGFDLPPQGDAATRASKVKAVFVYNFTQFIEWPSHCFKEEDSPFVIGVLGNDVFNQYLDEVVHGESVGNHPIILKQFSEITSDIDECHILFIDGTFDEIANVLKITSDKPILTVSDRADFTKRNGILRFFIQSEKVRFEINRDAANKAGLVLSPKLLKLATIYKK